MPASQLARGGCGGRSPAWTPPPPAAGSASPSASSVVPAHPTNLQPSARESSGRLSGRLRLSATLTSRGARRPGTSVTPGSSLCPAPPPPPHCRGTLGRPRFPSSSSRRGRSGESRAAAPAEGAEAPAPRGSVLEEAEAEAEGSARHSRAERVSPPGSGCSCQLRESSSGGGARGASWPWRGDPEPGTPRARLCLFGPLCRHLN